MEMTGLRCKYFTVLSEALRETRAEFDGFLESDVHVAPLNKECLVRSSEWKDNPLEVRLAWKHVFDSSNSRQARHFGMAVFKHQTLIGLAFGRVSRGKKIVRVDMLERSFTYKPLKGIFTPWVIASAMNYAKRLGANSLKVTKPGNHVIHMLCSEEGGGVFREADCNYSLPHIHFRIGEY
tara:strand:+ start:1243 stop:1782 length:540 start_codon:yes stop_codon:yes gene_type:complete